MIKQIKYATLLLLGLLYWSPAGAESFEVGNYQYTILDAEAKTVKVQRNPNVTVASVTSIVIADEVEYNSVTYKITEVYTFRNCSIATAISIGNNVTKISNGAFQGCGKVTNVTIPASVTSIGTSAFEECRKLQTANLGAAEGLTELGASIFKNCEKLYNAVLPPNLTIVPSSAFYGCYELATITIPATVTKVNTKAFYGCGKLKTIVCETTIAPTITSSDVDALSLVTDATIQVLSTAAKESFESNATWMAAASEVTVVSLGVAEDSDNSALLQHHNGHTADVSLTRTIRHEGYNSLCLPFALSAEQVTAAFGDGCDIQELRDDSNISAEGIEINFSKVTSMEAGKPYLVKPAATVTNPAFINMVMTDEIASSITDDVDFVGVFSPTDLPAEQDVLILGEGNTLHPLSADDREISGMRGYFVLKTEQARTAAKRGVKMVVNSKEGGTGIEVVTENTPQATKCLHNGQLHIIRNGVHYDAQGKVIQ